MLIVIASLIGVKGYNITADHDHSYYSQDYYCYDNDNEGNGKSFIFDMIVIGLFCCSILVSMILVIMLMGDITKFNCFDYHCCLLFCCYIHNHFSSCFYHCFRSCSCFPVSDYDCHI